jgi:aminoglycoside phosphotransferase (APT) family kinase protein
VAVITGLFAWARACSYVFQVLLTMQNKSRRSNVGCRVLRRRCHFRFLPRSRWANQVKAIHGSGRFIVGRTVSRLPTALTFAKFASGLAQFLVALQRIDPAGGPPPGPHNFYRGGALATYEAETRQAIAALKSRIVGAAATKVWETALASDWCGPPMWVHGDIAAGNLLLHDGRLSAVIDFGQLGIGDMACDLAIGWTLFKGKSREVFRALLIIDSETWARGRGWALWKALIVCAGLVEATASERLHSLSTVHEVLTEVNPS